MMSIAKRVLSWSLMFIMIMSCSTPSVVQRTNPQLKEKLSSTVALAADQYEYMAGMLPKERFPKTFENGQLKTSGPGWWCSGFYPGTLIYLFELSGDSSLWNESERILKVLEREQYNKTTHDLGFMMYCSFGNALRVSGNETYKQVIQNSSESLITRFNPKVGVIRSWDPADWNSKWQYPVIIDNMMNLEMLLWTTDTFSNAKYADVALTHANTTLKNHFRPDFSSYHVVSYDTISGGVEMKNTDQGYADESPWARGQSWGLYGYTTMYRFTKDKAYLNHAVGIANFIINHPNMPKDGIPYWDFIAPEIPNAPRDASAAAVIASALLELKNYVEKPLADRYMAQAETILNTLSSPEYLAEKGTNGGFILKHSVGNMPDKTEVDVPLTYADYYFVEAIKRYLEN